MPGGRVEAAVTKKEVREAAAMAVKIQAKSMQDPKEAQAPKLKLVEILKAEEQVVAGTNYHLKLKVKHGDKVRNAEATVWWQPWRKPEPYHLTAWKWSDPQGAPDAGAGQPEKPSN